MNNYTDSGREFTLWNKQDVILKLWKMKENPVTLDSNLKYQ